MKTVTLRAHFDGERIRLDEPFRLEPDMSLEVTVLNKAEDPEWTLLPAQGLAAAFGDSEPDYPLNLIRDPNPDYEGG